ncbi:SUMF1/EgtB/PvdO family nonheme iron enzyme [Acinetobacter sp. WZC-1]|uniref:SUMF1/EgtB/PvdO family nonheme iron enzyme n=1 Tax=Acinetobacter sp. WZC-1 TaxID=3459034 RepID=UPI00403E0806
MKKQKIMCLLTLLTVTGCDQTSRQPAASPQQTAALPQLGDRDKCSQYSGLPPGWQQSKNSGMVLVKGGSFEIGNNHAYPEEKSLLNSQRTVDDFYIDATEVTNAQFESFIQATGYVTEAEQQGEAAIFVQPEHQVRELGWWKLEKGISWRQPWGSHSARKILPAEPVRLVTLKDAIAYADWLGREIPTEEQWEYAAKAFSHERDVSMHDHDGHISANVWQGQFPYDNEVKDGFEDVAPVGCYAPNPFGLYDMMGNVWEYTGSPFSGSHDDHLGNHEQLKGGSAGIANHYTIKGGSYLCAENYCARYRATARQSQEANLAISHVGFRTVKKKET